MTREDPNSEEYHSAGTAMEGKSCPGLGQLGRRGFIKTIGIFGLATATVSGSETVQGSRIDYNPNREVPRVHGLRHTNHEEVKTEGAMPIREPIMGVISREKWRMVEAADRARHLIERRLSDLNPTPTVMIRLPRGAEDSARRKIIVKHETVVNRKDGRVVSSPEYSYEDLNELTKDRFQDTISARPTTSTHPTSPLDSVPIDNPTPVENMQIEVENVQIGCSSHNGGGNHYDYEYRNPGVPAGCMIKSDFPGTGTLGPPATDGSGRVFVTAGHLLGTDWSSADYVYQETNSDNFDRLGSIQDSTVTVGNDFDAGLIGSLDLNDTNQFASDSGSDQYTIEAIYGIRTRTWMKDNQNIYINKQGIATGRQSGLVGDVGKTAFESDHPESGGDSGGPYWDTIDMDNSYIVGIHEGPATHNYTENSRGTIMEEIENQFGISV